MLNYDGLYIGYYNYIKTSCTAQWPTDMWATLQFQDYASPLISIYAISEVWQQGSHAGESGYQIWTLYDLSY